MKKYTTEAANEPIHPRPDERDVLIELLDRMGGEDLKGNVFLSQLVDASLLSADWVETVCMETGGREVFVVTRKMLVQFLRCVKHEEEKLLGNNSNVVGGVNGNGNGNGNNTDQ